uniref:DNA-directed RNA polymerase RpoA/D/Rpb3-type domain-containing protein n=1 Tax=viral metagenome TaxID=1070528 RepID=A0A6C0JNQ7_9ZZZZ
MATIQNLKVSKDGFELDCELMNFPVSFCNGLRRVLLGSIPTVVVRDVKILENTTQLPHEMLKHRIEMLPIRVMTTDSTTIKDGKLTLNIEAAEARNVTTDDFVTTPANLIMKDRDLNTPLLFLKMRKGEAVNIEGRLALEHDQVSQVCTATTGWHIDSEMAKEARKAYQESGNDVRVFDNSLVQRYYSRNEKGRPNWIDLHVESVGVLKSKDILVMAIAILHKQVDEYVKEALDNIQTESDEGTYSVSVERGGHTIGYLMQEVIYGDANVNFVSYDIPHPLKKTMILRFNTTKKPDSILKMAHSTIEEYCSVVEKGL